MMQSPAHLRLRWLTQRAFLSTSDGVVNVNAARSSGCDFTEIRSNNRSVKAISNNDTVRLGNSWTCDRVERYLWPASASYNRRSAAHGANLRHAAVANQPTAYGSALHLIAQIAVRALSHGAFPSPITRRPTAIADLPQ